MNVFEVNGWLFIDRDGIGEVYQRNDDGTYTDVGHYGGSDDFFSTKEEAIEYYHYTYMRIVKMENK